MKKLLFVCLLLLNLTVSAWAAINLNTATFLELEEIKGIGPVKAKAIMDYRRQHGDFKTVDELDNVKGIGESTVAKLKQQLFVSKSWKLSKNGTTSTIPASVPKKSFPTKPIKADRPAKEPATTPNTSATHIR